MDAWHFWLIAAIILMIVELLGTGFYAMAIGIAALFGMLAALIGLPVSAQWFAFAGAAAVLAPLLKFLFSKISPSQRRSALAGEEHMLSGKIYLNSQGNLRVNVEGDSYPVKSLSARELQPGEKISIIRFDGITALTD